jgi:hypothetical protein
LNRDYLKGLGSEQGTALVPCDLETAGNIAGRILGIEWLQPCEYRNSLLQLLQFGAVQFLGEQRLPNQQDLK